MLSEEGQLTLSPDAIPTIIPVTAEDEVLQHRPHKQEVGSLLAQRDDLT